MPNGLIAAILALLCLSAACSTAPESSSAGASAPTTTDIQNNCVNLPPVALETCRRAGLGGNSGSMSGGSGGSF